MTAVKRKVKQPKPTETIEAGCLCLLPVVEELLDFLLSSVIDQCVESEDFCAGILQGDSMEWSGLIPCSEVSHPKGIVVCF